MKRPQQNLSLPLRARLVVPALVALLATLGLAAANAAPFSVYVVNYPLQYFAERIGGDAVEVKFPAPRDVDPAEWHPSDQIIMEYQQADLILLNGADYAHWVGHATLPEDRTVDTSAAFKDRLLVVEDAVVHAHGPHGTHAHAGTASITWLDPTLALGQARAIKEAFSDRMPERAAQFAAGFEALAVELEALDAELRQITAGGSDQPLLTSHPVYHYLAARYDLNIENLHWEPDEVPSEQEWEELDGKLAAFPARWLIWEDAPMPESVEKLEARGIASVVYNPLPQPPGEGDFLSVMRANVENLRLVFAK